LREAPFSLRELLTGIMNVMAVQADWKHLKTSWQVAEDVPDNVVGDSRRLKQVLMNLIVNAIKHTEQGRITLTVTRFEKQPEHILFAVSDTGVGIAKEVQQKLFQAFVVGEDPMTKRFAGAGLGLAISQDIIRKMRGAIWLDSAPKQGSTFYFSIKFTAT